MTKLKTDQEYLVTYRLRQKLLSNIKYNNLFVPQGTIFDLDDLLKEYEELKGDKYRKGTWIPTISGRRFWLLDPSPDEVEIFDIAYGLSRLPRFNAATLGPIYTIGQHSVLGTDFIEDEFKLHFLIHDAPEYLYHDIITPLKKLLSPLYQDLEEKITDCVATKFNIVWTEEAIKRVKEIDQLMLVNEQESLTPFGIAGHLPCLPNFQITEIWSAGETFERFSKAFTDLTNIYVPKISEVFNVGEISI